MKMLLISLATGLIMGLIDISPMIIKKLPRHSIIASFCFFFFISIIIFYSDLPYIPWWLQGGLISIAMMLPVLIHVGHDDMKPIPIITINTIVLGTLIGIIKFFSA